MDSAIKAEGKLFFHWPIIYIAWETHWTELNMIIKIGPEHITFRAILVILGYFSRSEVSVPIAILSRFAARQSVTMCKWDLVSTTERSVWGKKRKNAYFEKLLTTFSGQVL